MKYFSLTHYHGTFCFDELVVPLLQRMKYLEELSLYMVLLRSSPFLTDGTHFHKKIFVHMPHLRTFVFYLNASNNIYNSINGTSNENIQRTFTNLGYGHATCIRDYFDPLSPILHIFSLPFRFTRLEVITTRFPNVIFDTVTRLLVTDDVPMKYKFFKRISQMFPLLKYFSLSNAKPQFRAHDIGMFNENSSDPIIEYSHMISLDLTRAHTDYVEQFLLETETYLPRLIELKIHYHQLKTVTMDFTRETTRHNCSKVKRLIVEASMFFSEDVHRYFPSLSLNLFRENTKQNM